LHEGESWHGDLNCGKILEISPSKYVITELGGFSEITTKHGILNPQHDKPDLSSLRWLFAKDTKIIEHKLRTDLLGIACIMLEMMTGEYF
jgi:hypothetical protein